MSTERTDNENDEFLRYINNPQSLADVARNFALILENGFGGRRLVRPGTFQVPAYSGIGQDRRCYLINV